MKKIQICIVLMLVTFTLPSCFLKKKAVPQMMMPKAVNTINSVQLSELNLKHGTDYVIINTATADATVIYSTKRKGEQITIAEANGEFRIIWRYDRENGKWYAHDYEGIARLGYLTNDYGTTYMDVFEPEWMARNLAIYRLINASKVRGADGIIEPVISTNVEDRGTDVVFKTTVSAKLIKLNTDSK